MNSLSKWQAFYRFLNGWPGTIICVLLFIFFVAQAFLIPSGSMQSTMLVGDNLFVKKYTYGVPIPRIPYLEIPLLPDFNKNGHLISGDMPVKGDIVIFRNPENEKQHYVKRLVATSGDEVIYAPDGLYFRPKEGDVKIAQSYAGDEKKTFMGKIFVYDPYLKRYPGVQYLPDRDAFMDLILSYQNGYPIAMTLMQENGEFFFYHQVEEGHFFMMGDNRNASNDSRFWGSIEYRLIVGSPWFIYLSWDSDYRIRWNRIGKSVETLEEEMRQEQLTTKKAISDQALKDASLELANEHDQGL